MISLLYRIASICVLAPVAFVMMTCTHLFAWMVDVVNIPVDIDRLLTAVQESEETTDE